MTVAEPCPDYSDQFKQQAVRMVRDHRSVPGVAQSPATSVARLIGVDPGLLDAWLCELSGGSRPDRMPSEAEHLRAENQRLREDNLALRRATALLAALPVDVGPTSFFPGRAPLPSSLSEPWRASTSEAATGRGADSFGTRMTDALLSCEDLDAFLGELVRVVADVLVTARVPAWCSITQLDGDRPHTIAASVGARPLADQVQYEAGAGPCLFAAEQQTLVVIGDVHDDARWAAFGRSVIQHEATSVLSVPLALPGRHLASLNSYADHPHAFNSETIQSVRQGVAIAVRLLHLVDRLAGDVVSRLRATGTE